MKLSSRPAAGAPAANQFGVFAVHNVTPAQASYLRSLLGSKDLSGLTPEEADLVARVADELSRGLVSKKLGSSALDVLTQCPKAAVNTPVAGPRTTGGASEKQVAFITKLVGERGKDGAALVQIGLDKLGLAEVTEFTTQQASFCIDHLLELPKVATVRVDATEIEYGMYRKADGSMYRAYLGRNSGQTLCKKLVPVENPVVGAKRREWEFEYAGLATRFLVPAERMSLEEA